MDEAGQTRQELLNRLRALENATAPGPPPGPVHEPGASASADQGSEARLRAILETAVEGIITIDEAGRIESMNPAAERIFGYPAADLIGRNISCLMPEPYRSAHDRYMGNYLRTGQAKIIGIGREVVGQRRDGSVFPLDLSVSEVRLAQRRLFTGFVRDITERKQSEARLEELTRSLSEKNRELEAIVYVASHDLRSPLVNIQGFSRELERACALIHEKVKLAAADSTWAREVEDLLKQDVAEAVDYIQAGVKRLNQLLSGLLRFSRLGRAALRFEPVRMDAFMHSVLSVLQFQKQEARATVDVAALPDCFADVSQLHQVFVNLLDNAFKYLEPTRAGRVQIDGQIEAGRAIYRVADNGLGIATEHQSKVFEIFHRLDPHASEGEGLGLTIAARILERLNGKIWLESQPGVGTTFFVSLPAAEPSSSSLCV